MKTKHWRSPFLFAGTMVALLASSTSIAKGQGVFPNFPIGGTVYTDTSTADQLTWLGGDNSYGINIPAVGSFWTFHDTFVGKPGTNTATTRTSQVANTIAIATVNQQGNFVPTYYAGAPVNGQPMPFFQCSLAGCKYWPSQSFLLEGQLFVFLQIITTDGSDTLVGEDVARINNPSASPLSWSINYIHFANVSVANGKAQPAALITGYMVVTDLSNDSNATLKSYAGNYVLTYGFYWALGPYNVPAVALLIPNNAFLLTGNGQNMNLSTILHYAYTDQTMAHTFWEAGPGSFFYGTTTYDYVNLQLNSWAGESIRYNTTIGMYQVVGIATYGAGILVDNPCNTSGQSYTQPTVWFSTSAVGPFTQYTIPYTFSKITTDKYGPPITKPDDVTLYGLQEWPMAQYGDATIVFTFTCGSTCQLDLTNTLDLYYIAAGLANNPNPAF